ncbi:flippase [Vibrio vulnificus]|nr:flippase [Vibrio vulnificus]MCU8511628.1 flippase [Vibrio vulnificus]
MDKKTLVNVSSIFITRVAGYIVPLISLPYLVRVLEPSGYGAYAFSFAFTQYFVLLVNYGFDLSVTKDIAQFSSDREKVSVYFWSVLSVKIILFFISISLFIVSCSFSDTLQKNAYNISFQFIMVFAAVVFPQWLFQGKEELGVISMLRLVTQVLCLPMIFLFVNEQEDIWLASFLTALPYLMTAIFSMVLIFSRGWITWCTPPKKRIIEQLIDGWYIFVSTASVSLYTTSISVFLGFVSSPESVGIYVAASQLMQAAKGLISPLLEVYYPKISKLVSENKANAIIEIKKLFKIQFFLNLICGAVLYSVSPYIIHLLYGDRFEDSIIVLKILSLIPILVGCSNVFGVQTLLTHGYKKDFSKVILFSSIVSVFISATLCWLYSYIGAAVSIIAAEFLVLVLMYKKVKDRKLNIVRLI